MRPKVVLRLRRIILTLAVLISVALLWRGLLVLATAIALLIAAAYLADQWRKSRAIQRWRGAWSTKGKDVLLVYSNSPHWQRYVEENWLPRWGPRAVLLNWSERSSWERPLPPEVALFRAFAGPREFNPLAIVVPATGTKVHVVRFWRAFREFKHGKDRLLLAAEADLERSLTSTVVTRPGVANGQD
jgi:hypothetical protein